MGSDIGTTVCSRGDSAGARVGRSNASAPARRRARGWWRARERWPARAGCPASRSRELLEPLGRHAHAAPARAARPAPRAGTPAERRQVLQALAQRRQAQREDAQPVVEVLAEAPLGDGLLQIDVRRGQQRTSTLHRAVAPHRLERPLLEHAQQLGLQLERQLADLVEQQRAAVGHLEAPGAVRVAPVKAPFTWPKSSLSSRLCGDRRAVDGDEGRPARGARAVDGAREPAPCPCPSRPAAAPACPSPPPAARAAAKIFMTRAQARSRMRPPSPRRAAPPAASRARGPAGGAARGRPSAPRSAAPWPAAGRSTSTRSTTAWRVRLALGRDRA